ncbi:LTA synthase family protein [Paraburkholderia sp. Ac-20340]|uniref:LTA synthase family protein n=1 Tax=Paraburkholderia sp. Ac-20340 TaxID=2703888 RepID=UPI001980E762|nr:LTA synthase family protein [Paraburkholderia sp. Ac-20340]MBN3852520.1 LTA synthase family protein [Paraburkholderia sp. Ac-20340]
MPAGIAIAASAVACSFIVEAIAVTRSAHRRAVTAVMLHLAAFAVVAAGCLAITGRLFFSLGATLVLIALLAIVGNAKYASLREPLVFSDLSLFSQVFTHPRLYLPFLGLGKLLAVLAGIAAAFTAFMLEQPVAAAQRGLALAVGLVCLPLCLALAGRLPLTLHPYSDQRRFGFFATFSAYLINGLRARQRREFARAVDGGPYSASRPVSNDGAHPDVIVVQSESFFDARQLGGQIASHPYAHFDRARREAFEQGQLHVPAWGANTMRSEFAMLTGLVPAELGYARFYPYLFVRRACTSLAGFFRRAGYRTVAVHPYHADFFGRRRAFEHMHFERFLDIAHFEGAARVGPYIGDIAVADALVALLEKADDKPVFTFAITMENHGPLHLEAVAPGESHARHGLGEDAQWRDLTAYLRHVENADQMIGKLIDCLRKRARPAILCFYGDHVPAMSAVFNALGSQPANSDYFIWRNFGTDSGERRDVDVESLGSAIQRAMTGAHSPRTGSHDELRQVLA